MTGDESLTECRAGIEDAVRSNERIIPDDQWLTVRKLRGMADFTVALDDRVVADNDMVMNNREGSDSYILTNGRVFRYESRRMNLCHNPLHFQ